MALIKIQPATSAITLKSIQGGDTFELSGCYYIKLHETLDGCNAVSLTSGIAFHFHDHALVSRVFNKVILS